MDGLRNRDPEARAALLRAEADALVDEAVRSTGATRGNLQQVRHGVLRIVGQVGFRDPFLAFFDRVPPLEHSACGAALARGYRVIVPDVTTDPIFAGTRAGEVVRDAGCMAVQSTPIVSATGRLLGMLSTHYGTAHRPSAAELRAIDRIAAKAVPLLEAARSA